MIKQWEDELAVFTRAFAGAAIFGIPLVLTMEMWWIGKTLSLFHLIMVLVVGFVTNFGLSYVAGFRTDHSLSMAVDQAIDAMAVGIVGSAVLLFAMNQLRISDGFEHGTGMVMLLAVPLSLGASVSRQVFSGRTGKDGEENEDTNNLSVWQHVVMDAGATAVGGVFIGISIAPTDEGSMVSAGLTIWHLFAIIGLSIFLSYLIVFASGFDEPSPPGPFQHPISETMLSYVISLVVAFGMLVLFERIWFDDPLNEIIRQTVVLALPTSIGGAAGRLVV